MPLKTGEGEDYVLALKQELRETMKRMPYFVETPEEKQGVYWTLWLCGSLSADETEFQYKMYDV